jgi:hypothetical protein
MISDLAITTTGGRAATVAWRTVLEPLLSERTGRVAAMRSIATQHGVPYKTVERKFYALQKSGPGALVDKRACGPTAWQTTKPIGLSEHDTALLKSYVDKNQRKATPAIKAMRRDWVSGKITTPTEIDLATGYPRGWSEANLMRHLPNRFEISVARHGRSAAASERRLVYTTRANLWVGSHYLFDDMWHDHMVNVLDQRKTGRPLEFHALDLFSANKFAWGIRVRTEAADGRMEGLKEADMRFLLAAVLGGNGYSLQGTELVVEHGTAAIRSDLEALLSDETSGLVTVARSGMEGAAAAAHQYAGRSKGNFRFKAALESLGNLIHNEMAALPGQVGMDVARRPEGMHSLLKRNDALMAAISQLAPERAEMLRWPLLTIQQFQSIAGEIYARINARTDHELEGWDMNYLPERHTGMMRRMSPAEVWKTGARQLRKFRPESIALILLRDNGTEQLTRSGMFQLTNGEISGDVLRFDARILKDREKYLTVLNPYDPTALYVFDSRGRFVAACPRIFSVDRNDLEAVQRECGAAAKAEAARLAPFRQRHMQEARQKAADMRHNERVLTGDIQGPSRLPSADDLDTLSDREPQPAALDDADQSDLADQLRDLT